MPIGPISEVTWSEIVAVQAEAYSEIEPESLEVLKSMWLRSPECCFVYEKSGRVVGYLLAHSWNSEMPPKLYRPLPIGTEGTILFLHDLAISSSAAGQGVGKELAEHFINVAHGLGFQQIMLVSIQDSVGFWKKQGFTPVHNQDVGSAYGKSAQLMAYRFAK